MHAKPSVTAGGGQDRRAEQGQLDLIERRHDDADIEVVASTVLTRSRHNAPTPGCLISRSILEYHAGGAMTNTPSAVLAARMLVPDNILFQEVAGNAALLNLDTETYFGLDDVGTRMWQAMETSATIGDAAKVLSDVYDAPLETLQHDIVQLVLNLQKNGLVGLST
ncbi:MAG: PqqD family protein [Caulobacter sp.]|nr:PqqD family protein [Caulobacter sp.]